jgi:hypothetical protein
MGVFIAEFGRCASGNAVERWRKRSSGVGQFQFLFRPRGARKKIETGEKLWGDGSINRTLLKELEAAVDQ